MKYLYNKLNWLLILTVAVLFSGCKKFLDEPLSKNSQLTLTTTAQLSALLENYTTIIEDNNPAFLRTDDYGLTVNLYNARPASFNAIPNLMHTFWNVTDITTVTGYDNLWNSATGEWLDVFYANSVLINVDKVTGPDDEKARVKADAYLLRAYAYLQLVNTYCLPYNDKNKAEMGLPLKRSTAFDEDLTRASLEETYNFIEADIQEALKIVKPLVVSGKPQHWRSNTAAANGFAAKFYLERNRYDDAVKYADKALAEYSQLVDYNNPAQMYYGAPTNVTVNGTTPVSIAFPYTHNNQIDPIDIFNWKEFLYSRVVKYTTWWYVPSQDLLNLYDAANDRRYEFHIVENYSYASPGSMNGSASSPTAYSYPGYVFFFKDRLPSGVTTAEMYLVKAEALARMNKVGEAITAVNILRAKRIRPGSSVDLTAANQQDAVTKILQERRREMPFTQRWSDIRRYNNNEVAYDDVVLTKTFYPVTIAGAQTAQAPVTQTMEKDSRKYALPIPTTDISASKGALQQNTY